MNLDIGTLTIVFCLICLLQIFVLTVHFLLNKTHQVKAWWSLGVGLGLVMLGFLATFVGPFLSGKISQVANHLLFVFGQAFLYLGVMSFFERRPNRLWLAFFLAAFTILEIYFTTVPNNLAARRAILYLSHAGFLFLSGRVVYKYRTPSIQTTALFLAGAFFIYAVIFVFCTLFTLAYPPAAALLEPPPAQITTLLGGIIASTIYTFGFIFMLNQRSTYEMNHFKQHYELLFRTNPDAVMISRLSDGRIIEVNEGFTTQLGYTRPEIIANTISNLHFWHDISERQVMIKALTENGYCENLETIFQCKDGRLINVLVFARLVELDGIPHVIGVFHDVTHLKQVEAVMGARNRLLLLANSGSLEALMRATLDEVEALTGSQIGFYHFVDPDQQNLSLQTWSTRTLADMCRTTGTQQHYPVSTAGIWVDCIHQRRPVIHNDYLSVPHRKGLPEGHAPVIREMAVPVIRGTLIVAVVGVGNKPTDFTSQDVDTIVSLADLAWDIAERKRTEIALQQSEGRLHDLIAANSDGMVVVDAEGIICYGNPAASDLLKIPHEELVGSSFGLPIVSEQSYEIDLLLPGKHTRTVEMRVSQLTWNDKLATLVALRDTTERKRLQRELLKHATTDDLTGISNRRHFLELAEQEMKRFIRYKQPLTVVIIDIDYFKQINDRFGHAAGDDALASFAKICQKNIREIDLLARFGGDEFVLLLPGADCDQAYQMIERLRLVLIGSPIAFSSSDHKLHLTFTAGIAEMLGDEDTLDTLLVRADQILYRLKETGRNRVGIETSLDADLKKLPNKLHLLASLEPPLTGPIEPLTR